jgi:hypothetical protein
VPLPRLPALHLVLTGTQPPAPRRWRTHRGTDARPPAASPEDAIGYLREQQINLTYDPAAGTLQAGTAANKTTIRKQANPGLKGPLHRKDKKEDRRSPGVGASPRPGDDPPFPKTGKYGDLLCPRGT